MVDKRSEEAPQTIPRAPHVLRAQEEGEARQAEEAKFKQQIEDALASPIVDSTLKGKGPWQVWRVKKRTPKQTDDARKASLQGIVPPSKR